MGRICILLGILQSLFSSQASARPLAFTTTSLDHYQHEMLTRTLTWFSCLSYTPDTTTERLPPAPSYRWGTWSSELGNSLLNLGRMDLSWALHFCGMCMKQLDLSRLVLMIPPHQSPHSQVESRSHACALTQFSVFSPIMSVRLQEMVYALCHQRVCSLGREPHHFHICHSHYQVGP